jgi:hypothetical protein
MKSSVIFKKFLAFVLLFLLLLMQKNEVMGQVSNINVGNFNLEWRDNAQFFGGGSYSGEAFTGKWPAGWYRRGTIGWMGVGETYDVLMRYRNLVDASNGIDTLRQEIEYAPEVDAAVSPLREIRKTLPPKVIVDGKPSRPFNKEVDPNLPAAMMVETVSKTGWGRGGCWFKIKVYAFDNQEFSDFVIIDYTMVQKLNFTRENNLVNGPEDQIIEQYFSPILHFSPTRYGFEIYEEAWSYLDTWSGYMVRESELVPPGSTERDSLVISYSVDSNDPRPGGESNFGDPLPGTGQFVSTPYVGFSFLHADKSVSDQSDDINQPLNVINAFIDDLWTWEPEGLLFGWATTPRRESAAIGDPWNIIPDVSDNQMGKIHYQWVGPYDMALNDSIHFVIALGAGGIDQVAALQLGEDWRSGSISDAEKDSIIATGQDSLFKTLDKAKWAWTNYVNTGDFGIPWPPPEPDIKVTSGPGWNDIEWGYPDDDMFKDRRTGEDDFMEWRVYQKQGNFEVHHPNDNGFQNYKLIYSTTDRNVTSWQDKDVTRGVTYHYFVTAVDMDGNESSRFTNRTLFDATPFAPGSATTDKVKIVPNPYMINAGALNYSDPNKIQFFNLPPFCTLRIYNEVGDIVKVIEHSSGSADESWDQITESNQFITSGVYILSVQDAKDIDLNNLPGKNYKFIIIR